jgi:hypothetical protein
MNIRNIVMIAVALFGLQCTVNLDAKRQLSTQEKKIKDELVALFTRDVDTLTRRDMVHIRNLLDKLGQSNEAEKDRLTLRYIQGDGKCEIMSSFVLRERILAITDMLNKGPVVTDAFKKMGYNKSKVKARWEYDLHWMLSQIYNDKLNSAIECGNRDFRHELEVIGYYRLVARYEKMIGHEFIVDAKAVYYGEDF